MTEVTNTKALLLDAVQDLLDAERAIVERLPKVRGHAHDNELRLLLEGDATHSAAQVKALREIADSLGAKGSGAANVWARAILDDAERDTRTVAPGPLLDVALIGAIRKLKQAERVSYETAIALARAQGDDALAATLTEYRDSEETVDDTLAALLAKAVAACAES